MVSIGEQSGPLVGGRVRDALDWGRVIVAALARGVVAAVLGLALWAAAPAAIGWQPTTVMTGSMEPRLSPGDVVVSRPIDAADVRPGRILLADDPDQPGHLRMHRYVDDGPHGSLVTKGDANPQQDSTPLRPDAVHGVAFLRVPFVGAPVRWIRTGGWSHVGALAVGLSVLLALCTVDRPVRRAAAADGAGPSDGAGPGDGPGPAADGSGHSAGSGSADRQSLPRRRTVRRRARHRRRRRLVGGVAVLTLSSVGAMVTLPSPAAAAPFARSTATRATFGAGTATPATALTCTANGDGSVSIGFAYSGPAVKSFSVLNTATNTVAATGASGSTAPVRVTGASARPRRRRHGPHPD